MTESVVEALSRYEDRPPLSLPPLHDSIPTDAMDELFDSGGDGNVVGLSFTHMGKPVTIDDGNRIVIEPATEMPVP